MRIFHYLLVFTLKLFPKINHVPNGNIIIYPTDTLYGFGVDATNSKAIDQLNKLIDTIKKNY